jgi:hypothetical protein
MRTIKCTFKSNGEVVKVTAIVSDDLTTLSKSKKNQATDIVDEEWNDGETWGIVFAGDKADYELHFKMKKQLRTLKPVKAVTWIGVERDIVDDVQKLNVVIY